MCRLWPEQAIDYTTSSPGGLAQPMTVEYSRIFPLRQVWKNRGLSNAEHLLRDKGYPCLPYFDDFLTSRRSCSAVFVLVKIVSFEKKLIQFSPETTSFEGNSSSTSLQATSFSLYTGTPLSLLNSAFFYVLRSRQGLFSRSRRNLVCVSTSYF